MNHQSSYDEDKIKQFYIDRAKFNKQAKDIFGVNLHDISKDSYHDSSQLDSILIKNQKRNGVMDEFFYQVDQASQKQRINRQNMQLKHKIMILNEQSKEWKHKAGLWEKIKLYIINNFNKKVSLRSIRANTSQTILIQQFFEAINTLIENKQQSSRNISSYQQILLKDQSRRQQQGNTAEQLIKYSIQNKNLKMENDLLKNKIEKLNLDRKQRLNSIEASMQERYGNLQKQSEQKKLQNQSLYRKISQLNNQLMNLKKKNSFQSRDQDKQQIQVQFHKKLAKMREQQIKQLKTQIYNLNISKQDLSILNDKLKRIIGFAANINQQFAHKIASTVNYNSTNTHTVQSSISQYYALNNNKQKPIRQSQFKEIRQKSLKGSRYKIIKAQSLRKKND